MSPPIHTSKTSECDDRGGSPPQTKDENKRKEDEGEEEIRCPICLEHPHNAVLLLCSSKDKGCRPFICDTSYRHSNCLDQFRKSASSQPPEKNENPEDDLLCPLCRGLISGWKVVEHVRKAMNSKIRTCSLDTCDFVGNYVELRKHARREHPTKRPSEVHPVRQSIQNVIELRQEIFDAVAEYLDDPENTDWECSDSTDDEEDESSIGRTTSPLSDGNDSSDSSRSSSSSSQRSSPRSPSFRTRMRTLFYRRANEWIFGPISNDNRQEGSRSSHRRAREGDPRRTRRDSSNEDGPGNSGLRSSDHRENDETNLRSRSSSRTNEAARRRTSSRSRHDDEADTRVGTRIRSRSSLSHRNNEAGSTQRASHSRDNEGFVERSSRARGRSRSTSRSRFVDRQVSSRPRQAADRRSRNNSRCP